MIAAIRILSLVTLSLVLLQGLLHAAPTSGTRYNVLFVASDDLRPALGCYGDQRAKTPNIDKLASGGVLFNRAYCQQAVCSPSRVSLLTGLRPDSTRIYDLKTHFRTTVPGAITLPQAFKMQGYHTQAYGKIYHSGLDDPESWSAPSDFATTPNPDDSRYTTSTTLGKSAGKDAEETSGGRQRGPAWQAVDAPDNALPDGYQVDNAIKTLRTIKDKPFFLALGFHKPHLPFVAPQKYFDLHSLEKFQLPDNYYPPKGVTQYSMTTWGEMRSYRGVPKQGPVTEDQAKELMRAYYACMSYVDAQLGRVLEELKSLNLADKTIVILWGDHGWHLGEHAMWTKHTNFEIATRSPLIISAPGISPLKSDALVEFVDIYPTLLDLCGFQPATKLQGRSMAGVMKGNTEGWKTEAFSQFNRGKTVMGYSLRNDRYRYTEWRSVETSKTLAAELYDHSTDPGENANLAVLGGADETLTPTLSRKIDDYIALPHT